jgi:hypothetical protein
MTRRRVLRLGGLLLVGLAIALLVPRSRYAIWGWLRGDHYYRARPTCYWSSAVRSYEIDSESPSKPLIPLHPFLARLFGIRPNNERPVAPAVLGGGPETIPVLIELLRDRDVHVRRAAATAFGYLGATAEDGVPALAEALRDPDRIVRRDAAWALHQIGSAWAPGSALPEPLREALEKIDPETTAQFGWPSAPSGGAQPTSAARQP